MIMTYNHNLPTLQNANRIGIGILKVVVTLKVSRRDIYLLKYIAIVKTYLKTDVYNLLIIVCMFIIHPQQY